MCIRDRNRIKARHRVSCGNRYDRCLLWGAVSYLSLIHIFSFIRKYDEEINSILESLHELVDSNEDSDFVKQIQLIETFKGAGFLSAVSIMGEIGDFSAFSKPVSYTHLDVYKRQVCM